MPMARRLSCLLTASCLFATQAFGQMVPWLTRSADNARTGWNARETVLTADAVERGGIVRATIVPVIGDARGLEAQPLILPGVATPKGTRDVMLLPSMANVVRGVDAHDGSGIWQITLGAPVIGSTHIDMHFINQHWGCLSTGVIDPDLKRLYQVCWISPDGSGKPETARWRLFAINVGDGTQAMAPVEIGGKSLGQDFNAAMRKQRASLVETNVRGRKTIFGCAGTIHETSAGSNGFCFAFDVASGRQSAILAMTAGQGAGIWMAGQGIVADAAGDLYVLTGNGDFDGKSQWGESLLKLRYTPPAPNRAAGLRVVDHWTPWTDTARSGGARPPAMKMSGMSAPSEDLHEPVGGGMTMPLASAALTPTVDRSGRPMLLVFPRIATGKWADEDWGSAAPACVFSIGVCIAAGKDGIGYPVRTANMGGTQPGDLADPKKNCALLAGPPVWLTTDPGARDACPADPMTLNFFPNGNTAHLHMTPVQFFDPMLNAWTLFVWGENGKLRKWKISPAGALSLVAEGHEYASADVRNEPPGGMPGGFCAGSSNGNAAGSALIAVPFPMATPTRASSMAGS